MRNRAHAIDIRKYVRHVLAAGGALLLIAAAGLDGPGPNGWPDGAGDPGQQIGALDR